MECFGRQSADVLTQTKSPEKMFERNYSSHCEDQSTKQNLVGNEELATRKKIDQSDLIIKSKIDNPKVQSI